MPSAKSASKQTAPVKSKNSITQVAKQENTTEKVVHEKPTKASKKLVPKPTKEMKESNESSTNSKKVAKVEKSSKPKGSKKEVKKVRGKVEQVLEQSSEAQTKFSQQFGSLKKEFKLVKETLGLLSSSLRKLESAYNYDIKKVAKSKPKRKGEHKKTGFLKPKPVPEKFAKFIEVEAGAELSGPQITSKVWDQLRKRGLITKDKRVFKTNKELTAIFGIPKSVNDSTSHEDKQGFNFRSLQTYIANAMRA